MQCRGIVKVMIGVDISLKYARLHGVKFIVCAQEDSESRKQVDGQRITVSS